MPRTFRPKSTYIYTFVQSAGARSMAFACGGKAVAFVTEHGDVWAFGKGPRGLVEEEELDIFEAAKYVFEDRPPPEAASVSGDGAVFDGDHALMVSAGWEHIASVTESGSVWTWGDARRGQLGHGDRERKEGPTLLANEAHGGDPALMVACGDEHTLILTSAMQVWSFGASQSGQLGHGSDENNNIEQHLVPKLIVGELFWKVRIVMVAAGAQHNVALAEGGRVWTWGCHRFGQLGHDGQIDDVLVPKMIQGSICNGQVPVFVAAGGGHTAVVTVEGDAWVCGFGSSGQLGLGDDRNQFALMRVPVPKESHVLMAACGRRHTMLLSKNGSVWTFGDGRRGALGLGERDKLIGDRMVYVEIYVPERIDAQSFDNARISSIACGDGHSAAVTNRGVLYTWGDGVSLGYDDEYSSYHQKYDCSHKMDPRLIEEFLPDGLRVGCCFDMDPVMALAFAMGTHLRLSNAASIGPVDADMSLRKKGKIPVDHDNTQHCPFSALSADLLRLIIKHQTRPQGPVAKLEGLVRLLGGTTML